MSYEGYSQFLCAKGHYWTEDCLCTGFELKDNKCRLCDTPAVWENMVDVTNGSYDDREGHETERIDGYIELKIKKQDCCRECKQIIETTYEIPKRKKRK